MKIVAQFVLALLSIQDPGMLVSADNRLIRERKTHVDSFEADLQMAKKELLKSQDPESKADLQIAKEELMESQERELFNPYSYENHHGHGHGKPESPGSGKPPSTGKPGSAGSGKPGNVGPSNTGKPGGRSLSQIAASFSRMLFG
jgi:hypothetical protein